MLSNNITECFIFQLKVSQDHLQQCLTHLGSSLMERERRSFLLYSHFYERILQQETQLLYQREQVRVFQSNSIFNWHFIEIFYFSIEKLKLIYQKNLLYQTLCEHFIFGVILFYFHF